MKFIPAGVTRRAARAVLKTKANSPHIFFVGGVIGVVGAGVLACKATLDLDKKLEEIKNDLAVVKELHEERKEVMPDTYDERDHYKNLGVVYLKSFVVVGKLYGPAIVVGAVSIAALTGSHIQLTRRNAALTATLAAVTKAFDEYRIRVREEIGAERELDIHRGVKNELVEINGKKQVVKVQDPNALSPYAVLFAEHNPNWRKDADYNLAFLRSNQQYMNDQLVARGYVFLNEVYDALSIPRTQAGHHVGWIWDDEVGDAHIDFGIYQAYNAKFVDGMERSVWLDFNVDGAIDHRVIWEG